MTIETGLDRVAQQDPEALRALRGRVGLIAHPASVDRRLRHAREVLREAGVEVRALFGPEHGYGGEAQDMIGVASARDPDGTPIHSLYGTSFDDLTPTPQMLAGLDALVIDLQDVGSRYYTFVWTAVLALRAACKAGVRTVVLDRPNPLGGLRMEGAPQREGYRSFVGLRDVPVRHAMTIGELVRMACKDEGLDERLLEVVAMRGWSRAMTFPKTGLPWVLPSPNMPTYETARVYPGGCLLEGTNLSEGRGTTRPFELFGAPFVDGRALAELALDGAFLRATTFRPTFHKHAGLVCGGVQLHVTDEAAFEPYGAMLHILARVRRFAGEAFAWRTERYEYVDDIPAIDLLTGGPEYREAVDRDPSGGWIEDFLIQDAAAVLTFAHRRAPHLLYG